MGLCSSCHDLLVRWPHPGCATCGQTLAGDHLPLGYRCGDCRRQAPATAAMLSTWTYQPPVDSVLTGLKFQRLDYLGAHLGSQLAELARPRISGKELVVSVPLHWRRYLARGYNQAAMIARPLAKALGLPHARALRRRRATPAQSQLPRVARQKNLMAAFMVRRPDLVKGRHVILVDDIVTTGATLQTAAACLLDSGAEAVTGLSAARTPASPTSAKP